MAFTQKYNPTPVGTLFSEYKINNSLGSKSSHPLVLEEITNGLADALQAQIIQARSKSISSVPVVTRPYCALVVENKDGILNFYYRKKNGREDTTELLHKALIHKFDMKSFDGFCFSLMERINTITHNQKKPDGIALLWDEHLETKIVNSKGQTVISANPTSGSKWMNGLDPSVDMTKGIAAAADFFGMEGKPILLGNKNQYLIGDKYKEKIGWSFDDVSGAVLVMQGRSSVITPVFFDRLAVNPEYFSDCERQAETFQPTFNNFSYAGIVDSWKLILKDFAQYCDGPLRNILQAADNFSDDDLENFLLNERELIEKKYHYLFSNCSVTNSVWYACQEVAALLLARAGKMHGCAVLSLLRAGNDEGTQINMACSSDFLYSSGSLFELAFKTSIRHQIGPFRYEARFTCTSKENIYIASATNYLGYLATRSRSDLVS